LHGRTSLAACYIVSAVSAPADPLSSLEHEHGSLSRRVEELRQLVPSAAAEGEARERLIVALSATLEDMMAHFAEEEEGLFPALARLRPDLGKRLDELCASHDRLCGVASRILALARDAEIGPEHVDRVVALFRRFDEHYALHARDESQFLRELGQQLSVEERREITRHLSL
jgi:hypothetical protein